MQQDEQQFLEETQAEIRAIIHQDFQEGFAEQDSWFGNPYAKEAAEYRCDELADMIFHHASRRGDFEFYSDHPMLFHVNHRSHRIAPGMIRRDITEVDLQQWWHTGTTQALRAKGLIYRLKELYDGITAARIRELEAWRLSEQQFGW